MDALMNFGTGIFGGAWPAVWTLIKIVLIVAPLMLGVAYLTFLSARLSATCRSVSAPTASVHGA
jgi:NADH-quinone oxidoreductase subunit H